MRRQRHAARALFAHRATCACTEDEPFEQRVARETIRTMHARARHFPGGEQSRNSRSSVEVRLHAAHDVVGRWTDGYSIARQVEAGAAAHSGNQGESLMNE